MTYIKVNKSPYGRNRDELEMTSEHGRLYLSREQCVAIVQHAAGADLQDQPEQPTSPPISKQGLNHFTVLTQLATHKTDQGLAAAWALRIMKADSNSIEEMINDQTEKYAKLNATIKIQQDKIQAFNKAIVLDNEKSGIAIRTVNLKLLAEAVSML